MQHISVFALALDARALECDLLVFCGVEEVGGA